MCPLIYKNFVLGYLAVLMVISLLVYLKVFVLVPRGLEYGVMAVLAVAVLLSRTLVLGASLLYRILILGAVALVFYIGSKLIYPKQYSLLTQPKQREGLEFLLEPGDSLKEGKENLTLVLQDPKANLAKIRAFLRKEAPRPLYYLVVAVVLLAICGYFILN